MENMWRALEKVRNLLLRILNKQFLIFLFFLILSSVFWLIMTLNETYEKEMTIPLRLAGVPRKVVITDEPDSVVRFTVRDKGYMIAAYLADAPFRPLFLISLPTPTARDRDPSRRQTFRSRSTSSSPRARRFFPSRTTASGSSTTMASARRCL